MSRKNKPGLGQPAHLKTLHNVERPEDPVTHEPIDTVDENGTPKKDILAKILVVGDVACGKTSIISRYAHGVFSQRYKATIGVDFAWKPINWSDDTIVRLQLWDIAGQERFGHMTRVYYKEALGAIVVFDVTRVGTFDAVVKWKSDIDKKVYFPRTEDPIPCVLVGNKCDLLEEGAPFRGKDEMDEFCDENKFIGYFETSAKENINIEEAATALVKEVLERLENLPPPKEEEEDEEKEKDNPPVVIKEKVEESSEDGCKC